MTTYSDSQLIDASEHLTYEIWMLNSTSERLAPFNRDDKEATIRHNVYLESFLVHARLLINFFYAPPRKDDISAEQFFDSQASWQNWKNNHLPPKSQRLGDTAEESQ